MVRLGFWGPEVLTHVKAAIDVESDHVLILIERHSLNHRKLPVITWCYVASLDVWSLEFLPELDQLLIFAVIDHVQKVDLEVPVDVIHRLNQELLDLARLVIYLDWYKLSEPAFRLAEDVLLLLILRHKLEPLGAFNELELTLKVAVHLLADFDNFDQRSGFMVSIFRRHG